MPAKKKVKKAVKKVAKKAAKKPAKKVAPKKKVVAKKPAKKVTAKKVAAPVAKSYGKQIGEVTHWFGHINVAIIKFTQPISVGTKVRIVHGEHDEVETIASMQMDHQPIQTAPKGKEVGVKVKARANDGAKVYAV